jgi:hypothetical protein
MRSKAIVFSGVLLFLGYVGAGLFYGYLLGFNTQTPVTCPVCPHILSMENNIHKFIRRTIVLGTLNGLLFVAIGWLVRGLAAAAKKVMVAPHQL